MDKTHPSEKFGTTSACAENTVTEQQRNSELRNYLRVRGEYRLSKLRTTSL